MATAYATVAEFKGFIDSSLVTQDDEIQIALNAAAESIDRFTNRDTGDPDTEAFVAIAVADTKTFAGRGTGVLRIPDNIAITLVEVKDSPLDADSEYTSMVAADWFAYRGADDAPDFEGLPFTKIGVDPRGDYSIWQDGRAKVGGRTLSLHTVRVTARWGYAAAVPEAIKTACIAQAERWHTRMMAGMQDATADPQFGIMTFRRSLDPDIAQMIVQFKRMGIG